MNKINILIALFTTTVSQAQSTFNKLIASKHDNFLNNQWQGSDSSVLSYDAQLNQNGLVLIKSNNGINWNNFFKFSYVFNSANNITTELRESWNGSSWTNQSRYQYTYDGNQNKLSVLYELWNGSAWIPNGKYEYNNYNPYGGFGSEVVSLFINNSWQFITKKERSYYAASPLVETENRFTWNTNGGFWKNTERFMYTYVQDSIGSITHFLPDTANGWINDYRFLYSYSTTPQLLTENKKQIWDTTTTPDSWLNYSRVKYSYNNNNLLEKIENEKAISATAWEPQKMGNYIYNTANQIIEYNDSWLINQTWENNVKVLYTYSNNLLEKVDSLSGNGNSWNNRIQQSFTYDAQNNLTYKQTDTFASSLAEPLSRDFYYYSQFSVGLPLITHNYPRVEVFPNPSSTCARIICDVCVAETVSVFVCKIDGTPVMQITQPVSPLNNYIDIQTSLLASGNYLITLSQPSKIYSAAILQVSHN